MRPHAERQGNAPTFPCQVKREHNQYGPMAEYLPVAGSDNLKTRKTTMDTRDVMEMNGQLEKIQAIVTTLRQGDLTRSAASGALEAQLVRIWDIACGLQRMAVGPVVLDGYRREAMEQIGRLNELLYEQGLDPSDRWLINFGLACELVLQKIQTYQRLTNFAACSQVLTGLAATEEAA